MKNRKYVLFLIVFIVFIFIFSISNTKGKSLPQEFSYIYIDVNKGDTLWNISKKYNNTSYYTDKEYIEIIADINSVHKDKIKSGTKLLIPIIITKNTP